MSDDFINMHKRIAMGQPSAETHLKKGGKVSKYAKGGAVAESKVAKLPAMGDKRNAGVDFKAGKAKIATMKKGGMSKKPSLMIAIAVGKKPSARGR
jgi:hypothetical protein